MLKQRVITAVILAPLLVALILLPRTWLFATLLGLVFLLGLWEWTRLAGVRTPLARAACLVAYAIVFALLWHTCATRWWWVPVVVGFAWWACVPVWLAHPRWGATATRAHVLVKLLAGALVVVPAWCAVVAMHGDMTAPGRGRWWILFFACIVVAADIGAFTTGRRWGRIKLAPVISPGKTREGVYGALVLAGAVGVIGAGLLRVPGTLVVPVVVLALVTVLFSIAGDLFESLMKRQAGVKDAGNLFPGHGGLFDRMDSLVAALPVFALGTLLLRL